MTKRDPEANIAEHTVKVGQMESAGTFHIVWGAALFLGGAGLTVKTYLSAEPGGTYFIYWGAIL